MASRAIEDGRAMAIFHERRVRLFDVKHVGLMQVVMVLDNLSLVNEKETRRAQGGLPQVTARTYKHPMRHFLRGTVHIACNASYLFIPTCNVRYLFTPGVGRYIQLDCIFF
jgi:hypothetical protein